MTAPAPRPLHAQPDRHVPERVKRLARDLALQVEETAADRERFYRNTCARWTRSSSYDRSKIETWLRGELVSRRAPEAPEIEADQPPAAAMDGALVLGAVAIVVVMGIAVAVAITSGVLR